MSLGLVILIAALGSAAITITVIFLIMRAALGAARKLPKGEPGKSDGSSAHDHHHHHHLGPGWMD